MFDFKEGFGRKSPDDHNGISSRSIKIKTKIRLHNRLKNEKVVKILERLPEMGESIHIVGNGTFDYFTLVRHLISLAEQPSKVFYFATWTMSHNNVTQIINLFDEGLIGSINALTGDYFRTRESAIYGALATACQARGQRLFANKNHAKVTLLQFGEDYIVIEGSANFTANPRIEQYVISNHEGLFHFHKEWMDRLLQKSLTEKI